MKEEEVIRTTLPTDNISLSRPVSYDLLVRQSKKMGAVATKAFHNLRHMLHQEITLPSPERLLGNFPHTVRARTRTRDLYDAIELRKVVKKSHEIIASARTVFPMTLFPGTIMIDRTKVSITKRDFFWTSNAISFQIEDILNISCAVGPLFGSLTIASRVMSTVDHYQVNYLWRGDAIFLKHIIQGYIIAKNNNLETERLNRNELIETLCELGLDSDR